MTWPDRKSFYHSDMVKAGPFMAQIKSDPILGKDKKGFYVIANVDGAGDRYLCCENDVCKQALSGFNGRTVRITAQGGRDDASLFAEEDGIPGAEAPLPPSQQSAPPPAPQRTAPSRPATGPAPVRTAQPAWSGSRPATPAPAAPVNHDPIAAARQFIASHRTLMEMCQQAAAWNALAYGTSYAEDIAAGRLPPKCSEAIQADAAALFIAATRAGHGDKLPDAVPQ